MYSELEYTRQLQASGLGNLLFFVQPQGIRFMRIAICFLGSAGEPKKENGVVESIENYFGFQFRADELTVAHAELAKAALCCVAKSCNTPSITAVSRLA